MLGGLPGQQGAPEGANFLAWVPSGACWGLRRMTWRESCALDGCSGAQPTQPTARRPPSAAAASKAACIWALPHFVTFYIVFVLTWWCSEPGTAAIVAAVGAAAQIVVCMAASHPVLQLLTCGIVLLCAAVAHLAWECAGYFVLMVAAPPALSGEMTLRCTQRDVKHVAPCDRQCAPNQLPSLPSGAGLACMLSPWSTSAAVSRAVVWLAKARSLTTMAMCLMVRVVCTTSDWSLRAAVWPVVPLVVLVAHYVPLGRLAAALLPDDIGTEGILAGAPQLQPAGLCVCDSCD